MFDRFGLEMKLEIHSYKPDGLPDTQAYPPIATFAASVQPLIVARGSSFPLTPRGGYDPQTQLKRVPPYWLTGKVDGAAYGKFIYLQPAKSAASANFKLPFW